MPRLLVDPATCTGADLAAAVAWLRDGGLVIFPTDTYYGLAADPESETAIATIFEWKGRVADSALPMIAASEDQVREWFGPLDSATGRLASDFWPGPLSVIVNAPARVAPSLTAGGDSVAVRVPDHRIAARLCEAWRGPLPATSANRSGQPPSMTAAPFLDLPETDGVLVIDGGATPGGLPSTIVDARVTPVRRIRDGAVPWGRVLESIER